MKLSDRSLAGAPVLGGSSGYPATGREADENARVDTQGPARSRSRSPARPSCTAAVGFAVAAVTVYDNNFSSRAEYKEMIKSGGGKRCERKFRSKSKAMLASVKAARRPARFGRRCRATTSSPTTTSS